ncbi:uncharacterized protein L969DRAFT_93991 [Mixia osmundae IAM 14324]|uniref:RecA family profile 1 domain-containing protein n=1 Tax=Mixia osmundae (strain CBS 9802 / IAM 14324 / JCM 22182 / KY 12970) TaxID=764103 RepID=G7E8R5_MIXOS|nr:uncharacterized protein L969DRAFT_93991 [Mixia osmundae IAM 14324]KEI40169.1 hypothetical protein L969DRAFT_93991 [Mixia osmundae IAM 14324]GAA99533.1 hypothetical protein E5Q_06234 [Mixia osmundae IAM 14324]
MNDAIDNKGAVSTTASTDTVPLHNNQKASKLLQLLRDRPLLASGSAAFDRLFVAPGGLSGRPVIELVGPPGEGKSRIALSIALQRCKSDCQTNQVVIIDTEGALTPSVIFSAALALANGHREEAISWTNRIHLLRCFERDHFIATLLNLSNWLKQNTQVGLVIIDSVSAPLRLNMFPTLPGLATSKQTDEASPAAQRHALMSLVSRTLAQLTTSQVQVVATAQMKNLIAEFDGIRDKMKDTATLVPQAGEAWHPPQGLERIVIFGLHDGTRCAQNMGTGVRVTYETTRYGIR